MPEIEWYPLPEIRWSPMDEILQVNVIDSWWSVIR
jgi:hypothetical protein